MTDTVNVGTAANSGNGDPLRVAFQAINRKIADLTLYPRGEWQPLTAYTATPRREWVTDSGVAYIAVTNHTSGASFAADLASGKWLALDAAQIIADLSGDNGSSLVGYDGGTVQDVLDSAKPIANYTALRAYTGRATIVRITTPGIAGYFAELLSPRTDNGGTIITGVRSWRRLYDGELMAIWFGLQADGITNDTTAAQLAINCAIETSEALVWPSGIILTGPLTFNGSNKPANAQWSGLYCTRGQGRSPGIAGTVFKALPGAYAANQYVITANNLAGFDHSGFSVNCNDVADGGIDYSWVGTFSPAPQASGVLEKVWAEDFLAIGINANKLNECHMSKVVTRRSGLAPLTATGVSYDAEGGTIQMTECQLISGSLRLSCQNGAFVNTNIQDGIVFVGDDRNHITIVGGQVHPNPSSKITFDATGVTGGSNSVSGISMSGVYLTNDGETDYFTAPTVTFVNPGGGSGATATATISSDSTVIAVSILDGGQNYTSAPTITFSGGGATTQATATATVSGGKVTGVTITSGGSGYMYEPTITVSGGGGTNAALLAKTSGRVVTGITVTSGGSGYTSDTTVKLESPAGTGAIATPTIVGGVITAVTVTRGGGATKYFSGRFHEGATMTGCFISAGSMFGAINAAGGANNKPWFTLVGGNCAATFNTNANVVVQRGRASGVYYENWTNSAGGIAFDMLRISGNYSAGTVNGGGSAIAWEVDLRNGQSQSIAFTSATAFSVNAPLNPVAGVRLFLRIVNNNGSTAVAPTFASAYEMDFTPAAIAAGRRSVFEFYTDNGVSWYCLGKTENIVV